MLTDDLDKRVAGKENLNGNNNMVKYTEFDSTQVINEARLLLHCGSPLEDNPLILSPESSPMKQLNTNGSCLTNKPAPKKAQARKSVRFNMEKNVTFNVQIDSPADSDSDSTVENDRNYQTPKTNSMSTSDEESVDEDEDGRRGVVHNLGITSNDKRHIMGEIDDMERQKVQLAKDLQELRGKHEKEMIHLRSEYQQRREDYYDELDEVQQEMNRKRNAYNVEFSQAQDDFHLKERQEAYREECKKVKKMEEDLSTKKEQILEQEKELKEYEAYLERRHKSMNKKEEDLCLLQDELEELSDALKEKEKKQKIKHESLESPQTVKPCEHDEADIERTRLLLKNSQQAEHEIIEKLKTRDRRIKEQDETIEKLEADKQRLETKIKHLESQMSFNINRATPSSPTSSQPSKTTTKLKILTSSLPIDEKTGDYITPSTPRSSSRTKPSSLALFPARRVEQDDAKTETSSSMDDQTATHLNGEYEKIIDDSDELYNADTTLPTTDSKTNLSRTCLVM